MRSTDDFCNDLLAQIEKVYKGGRDDYLWNPPSSIYPSYKNTELNYDQIYTCFDEILVQRKYSFSRYTDNYVLGLIGELGDNAADFVPKLIDFSYGLLDSFVNHAYSNAVIRIGKTASLINGQKIHQAISLKKEEIANELINHSTTVSQLIKLVTEHFPDFSFYHSSKTIFLVEELQKRINGYSSGWIIERSELTSSTWQKLPESKELRTKLKHHYRLSLQKEELTKIEKKLLN